MLEIPESFWRDEVLFWDVRDCEDKLRFIAIETRDCEDKFRSIAIETLRDMLCTHWLIAGTPHAACGASNCL